MRSARLAPQENTMTLCREWSLVKDLGELKYCKPLKCRSWGCDLCAPDRRAQLMAQCAAGSPTRLLTLTVNPTWGTDPADRLAGLSNAWRLCVKRLRRLHPTKEIEFLAIVEETERGEPHLHILLRSPYVPQSLISQWMGELIDAPIVDIRRVRNAREVIRYVAKYVTKAPAQFNGKKRYWKSGKWEAKYEPPTDSSASALASWAIDRRHFTTILMEWFHAGYLARRDHHDVIIAWPNDHSGERKERPPNAEH